MSWKTEKESGEIPILLPYREMKTFVQGITGGTKLKHRDIIDKMTLEEKAAFLSGKMCGRQEITAGLACRRSSAPTDLTGSVNRREPGIILG